MYIQITTRCNMSCEHCCYDCTFEGEDMSLDVFREALRFDEYLSIGGGEPTIHPKFWELLCLAIGQAEHVWLATNGKKTEIAMALAKMARKGVIGCALSQDAYHDPIAGKVIEAFTKDLKSSQRLIGITDNDNDFREIRDVTGRESNAGRCDFGHDDNCICSELVCKPDGTIRGCGCEDAPSFGHIADFDYPPDGWEYGLCYRQQAEYIKTEETAEVIG